MKKIGIILTTFNNLEMTKVCLHSLFENTTNYELIVVDNNSTDGTQDWIKKQNIQLIELKEWKGVSSAINQGIRFFFNKENEKTFYDICWIHNDMTFFPKWLNALQEYLDNHPECGRVASHNMRDPLAPERPGNELPFLIRGECFKKIGMFDERFKGAAGKEDWDFNNRLLDNGWKIMITPESKVFHKGAGTRSGLMPREWEEHNNWLYWSKWGTNEPKV